MSTPPKLKNGRQTRIFNSQVKELNALILKERAFTTRKNFVTKDDLRASFDSTKGRCRYCSIKVVVSGDLKYEVHFMFFIPLKNGGEVHRNNIIPVCINCKKDKGRASYNQALERLYDYNTIPDLIQRLVVEILRKEVEDSSFYRDSVDRLKRELNNAITEFVNTLSYAPRIPPPDHKSIENSSTIADFVEQLVDDPKSVEVLEGIEDALKDIMISKRYRIMPE